MNKTFLAVLSVCFLIFSCEESSDFSFNGTLHVIDKYVEAKETGRAKRKLRSLMRRAKSENEFLSIYKRCKNLGDKKLSEKVLKKAFKTFPFSEKIRACYTFVLMQDGKPIDDELLLPLLKTDFAGLVAENKFLSVVDSENKDGFFSPEMVNYHIAAAIVTGNEDFLQNAAVILSLQGKLSQAAELAPRISENPYFWAMVAYDARDFRSSLDYALQSNGRDAAIITADAFLQQKDFDNAVNIWTDLCREEPNLSTVPYLNLIKYATDIGDFEMRKAFINEALIHFEHDSDVLAAFARFALDTNTPEDSDMLTGELRRKGLRSRKMVEFDNRPRVSPELPLEKFVTAMSETENFELQTEIFKYQYLLQGIEPGEIKKSDIYRFMEGEKPSEDLIRYFTWIFLVQKDYEAARGLLLPLIAEKMGHSNFHSDDVFLLPHWQKEFCAHIIAVQVPGEKYPDYTVPLRLLEGISYNHESSAALNHAILLETNYRYEEALALLNEISKVADDEKKSLCKFRRGRIFLELGDKESAYRDLEEAVKLDPSNLNARLLFRDLNAERELP